VHHGKNKFARDNAYINGIESFWGYTKIRLVKKRIQLPDDFYKHDFKQLAKVEKHPRTRIRFIGLSHIQNGKSYEQVAQYQDICCLLFEGFYIALALLRLVLDV
jgi:phage terminase large subunit-like protein